MRSAASSGRVALISAPVCGRIESLAGVEDELGGLVRMSDGVLGALRQPGDEGPDPIRILLDREPARDQDELVVGRNAELVNRDDPRVEAAEAQVDPLDVPEASEDRVDLAADQRRQQVETDVHLVDVGR